MFRSIATGLRLMISGHDANRIAYTMLPAQSAATHAYHPVDVPDELAEQLTRRFAHLTSGGSSDAELQQVGRLFFQQVMPAEVNESLARNESGYVLLSLQNTDVPWELLHDGNDFLGNTYAIGRSLPAQAAASAPERPQPGRALLIVNPTGDLPSAEQEGLALSQFFARLNIPCDYVSRSQASMDEVLLRLSSRAYDFIHYCGHIERGARTSLLLHGGQRLDAEAIARARPGAGLVFLNSCSAGASAFGGTLKIQDLVDAFAVCGAQAIIGPLFPIPDDAAGAFAQHFYEGLLADGLPVGKALSAARRGAGHPSRLCFVLYGDPALCYLPEPLLPLFQESAYRALHPSLIALLAEGCRLAKGSDFVSTAHVFLAAMRDDALAPRLCRALSLDRAAALAAVEPFASGMNEAGGGKVFLLSPNTLRTLSAMQDTPKGNGGLYDAEDFFTLVLAQSDASLTRVLRSAAIREPEGEYAGFAPCVRRALALAAAVGQEVNSLTFLVCLSQQTESALHRTAEKLGFLVPGDVPSKSLAALDPPPWDTLSDGLRAALSKAQVEGAMEEKDVLTRLLAPGSSAARAFEELFGVPPQTILKEM